MRPISLNVFGTLALATALCTSACSTASAPGGAFPGDPSPPSTPSSTPSSPPVDPDPPAPVQTANYSGIYNADAPLDFTQDGVLPGLTSPLLGALASIHDTPGQAIVDFANAAGVPVVSDIGSFGRSILAGLLDTQIKDFYAANPSLDQVAQIIMNIFELAKTGVLTNTLTIHTPNTDGTVAVELEMAGARFDFLGKSANVTLSAAAAATAKTSLTATLKARPNAPIADADLTLTGGTLTLPLGDLLLQALTPLVFAPQFGTQDLASTLQKLVPCNDIAKSVSDAASTDDILKYVITESVVKTICTTALTYAAGQITDAIEALTIDGVTINNGRGVLYDISATKPTVDHQSDRVADGSWTWSLGSIDVPSTFVGDRVGAAK